MVFSFCFVGSLLFKEWSQTIASIVQLLVCALPILLPSVRSEPLHLFQLPKLLFAFGLCHLLHRKMLYLLNKNIK